MFVISHIRKERNPQIMHCTRKITNDLIWVGANDRRLSLFEGVYPVPHGVSYNSYLLTDEKTVLFDTADKAVGERFFENLTYALDTRPLDYLVVQHMEPDHSACVLRVLEAYPAVKLVCNTKTVSMIRQFFPEKDLPDERFLTVKEGDVLCTGKHTLSFVMAPMVHWPEVMVTYDATDKILFSADAFGTFGALDGALFADEVDFMHDHLAEARRYYTNIVGKYGPQVQTLLKKAASLDIALICPLHGYVWRRDAAQYIEKYNAWSSYTPEIKGVLIAYASVYGNTENAAELLSTLLRERGIPTAMYDTSVTHSSYIVAEAFRYSHLIFAAPTYNAGIFVTMDALLRELAAHNLQNRTLGFIENGTWAPIAASLMKDIFAKSKGMTYLETVPTVRSAVGTQAFETIRLLAEETTRSLTEAI